VEAALERNLEAPYSYDCVGASKDGPPAGWRQDDQRVHIGRGDDLDKAVQILNRWVQFDLSWVFPYRQDVPIQPGALFAFCSHQYGIWALNICRIIYLINDDSEQMTRVGFAYGTVGDHSVRGEETFTIELDKETDNLYFRTTKFSRPAQFFTYLMLPLTTMTQDRFTRDALARIHREVTN
jgi:uncharacterized protein (UPF0548 family)